MQCNLMSLTEVNLGLRYHDFEVVSSGYMTINFSMMHTVILKNINRKEKVFS